MNFTLRPAILADVPAITTLIAASVHGLSQPYTTAQVESALHTAVFGVDSTLIADGTFIVAENADVLAGCGGWSKRATLFGGDQFAGRATALLDPTHDAAKIRAFFVHPDWARRGIGTAILRRCEADAAAHGFCAFELMATLPGQRLYQQLGYAVIEPVEYTMSDGMTIDFVRMRKVS